MCGIYGFVGKPKNKKARKTLLKLIKNLAIETEVRGIDATGLFAQGKYVWFNRSTLRAKDFYSKGTYWKNAVNDATFFLGHNRAASVGSKDRVKFAHPFSGKYFALAHNGTIPDIDNFLSDEAYEKSRGENDSKKILRQFNSAGKIDVEFLSFISKYALVIFDKRINGVFVARDNGRPLGTVNFGKELGVRVFASTPTILAKACVKSNIDIDKKRWYDFEPYTLYRLYGNNSLDMKKKEVYEYQKSAVVYEIPKPKRVIRVGYKNHRTPYLVNERATFEGKPKLKRETKYDVTSVMIYNQYAGRMTTVDEYNEFVDTINENMRKKGRSYRAKRVDVNGLPIREDTKKVRQRVYDNIFNRDWPKRS